MTNFTEPETAIRYARARWEDGEHRVQRASDDARRDVLEHVVDGILEELERRIGQTFSTLELAELQDGGESWAQRIAHERAPDAPWAWEMDVVFDAACFRYSRRANDYQTELDSDSGSR